MPVEPLSRLLDGHLPGRDSGVGRLVALSRPRFWLYLAGPALVGAVYAASTPAELSGPAVILGLAYFLLPANVFLYGVNDVFDADIDRHNPKKDPAGPERRYSGDRWLLAAVAVSGLLALPLFVLVPLGGRLALLAFLLLSVQYSAPPLRFKTTPVLDSLSNGLYVLPAVVTYEAVAGSHPPLLALLGGWLWTMAMHTFSAIPDVQPDREAGVATTATLLGPGGALAYCGACWAGAAVAMAAFALPLGALFALYPILTLALAASDVSIDRAYWWFPAINGVAGMVLTLGGVWLLLHGG